MPDEHEERFRQHEAMMEGLARILEAQHGMNQRQAAINEELKAGIEEQREFNRQQIAINQRLETLLERAWRSSTNGHTD